MKNIHKAFIEVNEAGTEAAAATAIVFNKESASFHPTFNANKPFIYLIKDNHSDTILFIGRLMNPLN